MTLKQLIMMDEDFDGKVTEAEFMRGHLRAAGFSSEALNVMREQFEVLDHDHDGVLTAKDLEMADERSMNANVGGSVDGSGATAAAHLDQSGLSLQAGPSATSRGNPKLLV